MLHGCACLSPCTADRIVGLRRTLISPAKAIAAGLARRASGRPLRGTGTLRCGGAQSTYPVFAQAVAVVEEVSALAPRLGILGALVALYVGQGKQPQVGAGGARGAGRGAPPRPNDTLAVNATGTGMANLTRRAHAACNPGHAARRVAPSRQPSMAAPDAQRRRRSDAAARAICASHGSAGAYLRLQKSDALRWA